MPPAATSVRLCRNRKAKSARSLSQAPQAAKHPDGANRRVFAAGSFNLWDDPVAKNLHLTVFLLIFHGDSTERVSAVPDLEMSYEATVLKDAAVSPAGRQRALRDCPWHDVNEMLQAAGLRAPRQ